MKAVVLAGGKGTRLAPYTTILPKPLMPIGEMPILEVLLRQMKRAGVNHVVLTVGHLASLLRAYFSEGMELTGTESLVAIAAAAGLDGAKAEQCLADPQSRQAAEQEDQRARAIGVEGVPFFIFNGKLAVSGAQGPEALLDAMRQAEAVAA